VGEPGNGGELSGVLERDAPKEPLEANAFTLAGGLASL